MSLRFDKSPATSSFNSTRAYLASVFVGEQLAKNKSMEEIKKEMHGMVAEGIPTTKAVYEYSTRHRIEMPLKY